MSALWFQAIPGTHYINAYSPRGDRQGRIAPSGNPEGGFHVLTPAGLRQEHVAAWAATVEDAKHAFVATVAS